MGAIEGKYPLGTRIRMVGKGLTNRRIYDRGAIEAQTADLRDDADFMRIYERCAQFTMTSLERMFALHQAIQHTVDRDIQGDFVECGVWRGGSTMMAAETFVACGDTSRELWLYDTFEGMTEPTAVDRSIRGEDAKQQFEAIEGWCAAPLDEVKRNLDSTGYPAERLHFIEGMVEDTIPAAGVPQEISVLRLDTDFYESTKVELEHLYPKLSSGGILIIDDYGYWQGARRAVDEYFAQLSIRPLLSRIDFTGRIAIKP